MGYNGSNRVPNRNYKQREQASFKRGSNILFGRRSVLGTTAKAIDRSTRSSNANYGDTGDFPWFFIIIFGPFLIYGIIASESVRVATFLTILIFGILTLLVFGTILMKKRYKKMNSYKKTKTRKILKLVLLVLMLNVIMIILYNLIYVYPYITDDSDDYEEQDEILRSEQIEYKYDSILFLGSIKFGDSAPVVLRKVRECGISKDIFFDYFTESTVAINDTSYNVEIKYCFDHFNRLRLVNIRDLYVAEDILIEKLGDLYISNEKDHFSCQDYKWNFLNLEVFYNGAGNYYVSDEALYTQHGPPSIHKYTTGEVKNYYPIHDSSKNYDVKLTFLGFSLTDKISNLRKTKNVRVEEFKNLKQYYFQRNAIFNSVSYKINCCISTINDTIGLIKYTLNPQQEDFYQSILFPLYENKYGNPSSYDTWTFKNQSICLRHTSQNEICAVYSDYILNDLIQKRIKEQVDYQQMIKDQQDSIKRAMEEAEKLRKKEIELLKKNEQLRNESQQI